MIQTKKLDISGRKAGILTAALQSVSDGLPREMRHVYGGIIRLIQNAGRDGKISLNEAQQSIVRNALDKLVDPDAEDMHDQLTMVRREYRAKKEAGKTSALMAYAETDAPGEDAMPWLLARSHQDIEKGVIRTLAVYFDTDGIQGPDGAVDIKDFDHMYLTMCTEKELSAEQLEHSAYMEGCSMAAIYSTADMKLWSGDCATARQLVDEIHEQHSFDPFGWGGRMHPAEPDRSEESLLANMLEQIEHAVKYGLED